MYEDEKISYDSKISDTTIDRDLAGLGDEEAIAIAEALKVNHHIIKICLSRNKIGAIGAAALAEALKVNHSITTLDLHNNRINNEGAIAIAEALQVNHSIVELDLDHNNLGEEGIAAITESLNSNDFILKLNIGLFRRVYSEVSTECPWIRPNAFYQYFPKYSPSALGYYESKHIKVDVDDILKKNQLTFNTNFNTLQTFPHLKILEDFKKFFSTLSYKELYILSKQALSLSPTEDAISYNKIARQGFAEKLFYETQLDKYLPSDKLHYIYSYLTEKDIHDIAFMGQISETTEYI